MYGQSGCACNDDELERRARNFFTSSAPSDELVSTRVRKTLDSVTLRVINHICDVYLILVPEDDFFVELSLAAFRKNCRLGQMVFRECRSKFRPAPSVRILRPSLHRRRFLAVSAVFESIEPPSSPPRSPGEPNQSSYIKCVKVNRTPIAFIIAEEDADPSLRTRKRRYLRQFKPALLHRPTTD